MPINFAIFKLRSEMINQFRKPASGFGFMEINSLKLIGTAFEGVKMLEEAGFVQAIDDDLTTDNEKNLGKLVKAKFKSDIFVLDKYPKATRPFYSIPNPIVPSYTNSFDVIMRGEEICSGSQRIHDYQQLVNRMEKMGISTEPFKIILIYLHVVPELTVDLVQKEF